jgi:hypothetical protein
MGFAALRSLRGKQQCRFRSYYCLSVSNHAFAAVKLGMTQPV